MISKISVRNFKSFQSAEIFPKNLNLFTGMNGIGKSTFIQSLLLLRQSYKNKTIDSLGLSLKGEIIDIGKGKDAQSINADSDTLGFEVQFEDQTGIKAIYQFEAEQDLLPVREFTIKTSDRLPEWKYEDHSLFNNNFQYLGAERIGPQFFFGANLSKVQQSRTLGYKGELTALFVALFKLDPVKVDTVKHLNAKSDTLIENIECWLSEITPGVRIASTYLSDLDIVKLVYQFEVGNDMTPEFSPINVGFGFTYVLPVLTAILSAKRGDLLIIENPESHLHPQGQAKLGELLSKAASGGIQLIIESHSDHLLNGIRVAVKQKVLSTDKVRIFFFERSEGSNQHVADIIQPIIDKNGRMTPQPTGFFDEISKQLDKLLS